MNTKHRATLVQFIAARRPLSSVKSFSETGYITHLTKVWQEADGFGKKALLQRAQEALTERFGLEDGARMFAEAMKKGVV